MSEPKIDPTQISPADLAKLLTKAGGVTVTEARIRQDLQAGAPANADGSLHVVHYTAWLVAQTE